MSNRKARRQHAAKATQTLTCNVCGKAILTVRVKLLVDLADLERRAGFALAEHQRKTGCKPPPAQTILDHIPPEAPGVEMICAGCGLIVETFEIAVVRADPVDAQQRASAALKAHTVATGCPGSLAEGAPKPKRRDGRCVAGLHVDGCRCEERPSEALPQLEGGVFRPVGAN